MQNDPNMNKFSKPTHGDLSKWAKQGVFMLNDILTVQDSTPNAHKAVKINSHYYYYHYNYNYYIININIYL